VDPDARELAAVERDLDGLRAGVARLRASIARVFFGHEHAVDEVLCAFLAGGHVLLEGVPGLGKTTLVRALAESLDLAFQRIQFTPDLMPADVLGARVLDEDETGRRRFRFEPGPIFAHVVLADEINRATPRTQSALLEAMQERQVTAFGETRTLARPFFLVATQNPIEMEGTYPLPEAQLDRFALQVELEFPPPEELSRILTGPPRDRVTLDPVVTKDELVGWQELVRDVPVSEDVTALVARIVLATHPERPEAPERVRTDVRHGASPRGGEALLLAGRARALIHGRLHVTPEDVHALALSALRHRFVLGYEGEARGTRPRELVEAVLEAAG